MIRPARPGDADVIATIWNAIIRDTVITFTTAEKTPDALARSMEDGAPFVVAEHVGGVVGFATASQFRGGPGYAHTWEHSIHVADTARGRGIGRALMAAIEAALRARGAHSVFAGVSGENAEAIAFHTALGYAEAARLREVGWKFGRWHDLVLLQKML
ncbi:phosphinothricin N-acetyltransferase, putative [Roseibacterium elongatum DSM 19469]|uniref:Phosphinothricin N-acetyltransferase, putative n=1 Tax=Roseicyclus elongatus DSM 19469 TaxID=1294273 RepID=W8SJS2_9RHOB|nr:GNAT family N-acetyltransferase [Roseibacterium elongatum]AHM02765.1 phosphinothricin N-acetyltransferase, putative [Roseibacterium elongatum DSM 19469]